MKLKQKLTEWAERIKCDTVALYIAAKRPETPWYAKAFALIVVAYALSPVDLIPDFIPVLGYLDDLIIIPIGIYITAKMIPSDVLADCRKEAKEMVLNKKWGYIASTIIICLWFLIAIFVILRVCE